MHNRRFFFISKQIIKAISKTSNEYQHELLFFRSTRISEEHTTPQHSKMYNDKTKQKGYMKKHLANGILPPQSGTILLFIRQKINQFKLK